MDADAEADSVCLTTTTTDAAVDAVPGSGF